jgi:hypothetical protein
VGLSPTMAPNLNQLCLEVDIEKLKTNSTLISVNTEMELKIELHHKQLDELFKIEEDCLIKKHSPNKFSYLLSDLIPLR